MRLTGLRSQWFRIVGWSATVMLLFSVAGLSTATAQERKYRDYFTEKNELFKKGKSKGSVEFFGQGMSGGKFVYKFADRNIPGVDQMIEVFMIWKIDFADAGEYKVAMRAYDDGKYQQAVGSFAQLASKSEPWWLPSHAMYYLAESHRMLGNRKEAVQAYRNLLKKEPENRFTADALYRIAIMSAELGNLSDAEKAVSELSATGIAYGPGWSSKGELLVADIYYQKKDYNKALPMYQSIARSLESSYADSTEKAGVYSSAMVRVGVCMIENGQMDRANKQYEKMVTSENEAVKAAGYLGRGQIKLKKEEFREGVYDFLRVVYQYREQTALKVDAALGAGTCYGQLYKTGRNESDKNKALKMYWILREEGRDDLAKQIGRFLAN